MADDATAVGAVEAVTPVTAVAAGGDRMVVRFHTAGTAHARAEPRVVDLHAGASMGDFKAAVAIALGVDFTPDAHIGAPATNAAASAEVVKVKVRLTPGGPDVVVEAPAVGCTVSTLKSLIAAATGKLIEFIPETNVLASLHIYIYMFKQREL